MIALEDVHWKMLFRLSITFFAVASVCNAAVTVDEPLSKGSTLTSAKDPNIKFKFDEREGLFVEAYGRKVTDKMNEDSLEDPESLTVGEDGCVSLLDEGCDEMLKWNPTKEGVFPYSLDVETDRRVRVRDSLGKPVWQFPSEEYKLPYLETEGRNFLRSSESVVSSNGKYFLGLDARGVLSTNVESFNKVPRSTVDNPRILMLESDGSIVLKDLNYRVIYKVQSSVDESQGPFILEIDDDGVLQVLDADANCALANPIFCAKPSEPKHLLGPGLDFTSKDGKSSLSISTSGEVKLNRDKGRSIIMIPAASIRGNGPFYGAVSNDGSFQILDKDTNSVVWKRGSEKARKGPYSLEFSGSGNSVYLKDSQGAYDNLMS